MQAMFKYPGSKWNISSWIISHFPEHKVYLEPFFGSGAVFFSKTPVAIETINDINDDIVNLFKVCRDRGAELASAIELTPYSRSEFLNCVNYQGDDPLERARTILVRYQQCFGSSTRCSKYSWKNSQTANSPNCPQIFGKLPEMVVRIMQRLKGAQIENCDALKLIERYDDPQTLIYCDPPYLKNTRKSNIYVNEITDEYHERLLRALQGSKSKIIISAYDNDMYNDLLHTWYTDTVTTGVMNGMRRIEKIYLNFQPPLLYFS